MKNKKKNLAAMLLGRKGGNSKLKKHGREAFKEMARRRWEKYKKDKSNS